MVVLTLQAPCLKYDIWRDVVLKKILKSEKRNIVFKFLTGDKKKKVRKFPDFELSIEIRSLSLFRTMTNLF